MDTSEEIWEYNSYRRPTPSRAVLVSAKPNNARLSRVVSTGDKNMHGCMAPDEPITVL